MPVILVGAQTILIEFLPGSRQFSLFSFGGFGSAGVEPRALSMLSKCFATEQFLLPPPPGH